MTREPVGVVGADHAVEFPDRDPGLENRAGARLRQLRRVQAGRSRARLRRTSCRTSSRTPVCRPACSTSSWAAARKSERRCSRTRMCRRSSFTGSVSTGRMVAASAVASTPMKKFQLEMGGKNPLVVLDDADLKIAVECAVQRRLLLDRPALHGVLAPDRDRRHPRQVRRRGHRAAEIAGRRRRLQEGHANRAGGRPEPARPGSQIHRDRRERRRQAALGRRTAQPREARLLSAAGALHRGRQQDAHRARGNLRPGRHGDQGQGLRRGAGDRQRHRIRPVLGHLHHQPEIRQPLQAQLRKPAW